MRLCWEEFKLKMLLQRTHDKSVNLKLGRLIGGNRDLTIKFVMRRVCHWLQHPVVSHGSRKVCSHNSAMIVRS